MKYPLLLVNFVRKIHPPCGKRISENLKIEKRNGKILCSLKDYQKDNENDVCKLHIVKQIPDK